jgi:hypothetical protein
MNDAEDKSSNADSTPGRCDASYIIKHEPPKCNLFEDGRMHGDERIAKSGYKKRQSLS